ncbi:MAG: hypothetical protein ACK4ZM_04850, partial [bacterium]
MKNLIKFIAISKIFKIFIYIILGLFIFMTVKKIYVYHKYSKSENFSIFLGINPDDLRDKIYIMEAYKSVMEEEGIPYKIIDYPTLCSLPLNNEFINNHPAVILPDGI